MNNRQDLFFLSPRLRITEGKLLHKRINRMKFYKVIFPVR